MLHKVLNPMAKPNMVLDLLADKQQAISENLANIHTPGYKKKDINFADYLSRQGNSLETKLSEKMGASPVANTGSGEVNATEELMEMQKTQLHYTIATRHMASIIQQLKQVTQTR